MLICSHIGLSVHTGADGDVCVCVTDTVGGWCTTASVSKYFPPSRHSYARVRITFHFPGLHADECVLFWLT